MDEIEADRDKANLEFVSAWDRVEKGPQMMLNARLDLASSHEARGWTIEAGKTRDTANREFSTDSLVLKADLIAKRYEELDALWIEKNRALADVLVALEDAGAIDRWRETVLPP